MLQMKAQRQRVVCQVLMRGHAIPRKCRWRGRATVPAVAGRTAQPRRGREDSRGLSRERLLAHADGWLLRDRQLGRNNGRPLVRQTTARGQTEANWRA